MTSLHGRNERSMGSVASSCRGGDGAITMCISVGMVAVFFLVSDIWSVNAENCDENSLQRCMQELNVLTNNQDLAFAHTEEELKTVCKHLQEAMVCVNRFTERCFDAEQQQIYQTLTRGAQQLLSDLCTDGSEFRKKYLKHAGCYKQLSADYKKCSEDYIRQQEVMKTQELPEEEQLRKSCCLFDGYKQCTRNAVLAKCDAEAADLGEQIVIKAGGFLVQNHCRNYRYDSPECASGCAAHASLALSALLALFAILRVQV
ncbi:uncharacterized protein LOC111635845 [Centruroides sculpturatus]|uniref:uncharacterized protein LOC111635845 n=1 Tax=Centruroides sculpturatus TaxID=218467 RepID=UPI000C6E6B17|nr:uncharacterized protein LOC111635845 [Centruroides sculpturatus]